MRLFFQWACAAVPMTAAAMGSKNLFMFKLFKVKELKRGM